MADLDRAIDEFLTYEFVREQKLFAFGYNPHHRQYEIESRQFADVKQKLLEQGADAVGGTPEELDKVVKDELRKWTEVIRQAGIKMD